MVSKKNGSPLVPPYTTIDDSSKDILCEHHHRRVGNDNCVAFEGRKLQIPEDRYRMHDAKAKVRVHHYPDGQLAVFQGPGKLAGYDCQGTPIESGLKAMA
jgi:hypothetical protein